jgi:hypothetical protein
MSGHLAATYPRLMVGDDREPSPHGVSLRRRIVRFAKWRVRNMAAGLLLGSVVCLVLGPGLVLYGLLSGNLDVVLPSLGITLMGAVAFMAGPAVLDELIFSRGKQAWRE